MRRLAQLLAFAALSIVPLVAQAQAKNPATSDDLLTRPIALVVALALVAILPFAFMTVTAFVKISTVLQIVRGAIGAQGVPSNTLVMALAGALTLLAMAPVGTRIADRAEPLWKGEAVQDTPVLVAGVFKAAVEPLRDFMRANASEREKKRFFELAKKARPEAERDRVAQDDLVVLIPSFMVTELLEAFALGFALYLPFLVIDLVVGNVLLSLGMQMMNPTQVSLPFKLLLFVAIDGWGLLAQALVTGYATSCPMTNPYEAPTDDEPASSELGSELPPFFPVGITKLWVMSIATMGFYLIYWFERQWRYTQARTRQSMMPFWRGVFSIFFVHRLFREIVAYAHDRRVEVLMNPNSSATMFVALSVGSRLVRRLGGAMGAPGLVGILSLVMFAASISPIAMAQREINQILESESREFNMNTQLSAANIIVIVLIGGFILYTFSFILGAR